MCSIGMWLDKHDYRIYRLMDFYIIENEMFKIRILVLLGFVERPVTLRKCLKRESFQRNYVSVLRKGLRLGRLGVNARGAFRLIYNYTV